MLHRNTPSFPTVKAAFTSGGTFCVPGHRGQDQQGSVAPGTFSHGALLPWPGAGQGGTSKDIPVLSIPLCSCRIPPLGAPPRPARTALPPRLPLPARQVTKHKGWWLLGTPTPARAVPRGWHPLCPRGRLMLGGSVLAKVLSPSKEPTWICTPGLSWVPPAFPRGFPLRDAAVLTPRVPSAGKGRPDPSPTPPCLFSVSPRDI